MVSPLTIILLKILAKGFYRANAGFLIFIFVTFFSYFFFIQVLNPHLTPQQLIERNLSLGLAFISTPIIVITVFTVWLIYTVKALNFIKAQLELDTNQFLVYSSTSLSKGKQFQSWLIVQLIILLPVIGYGIFALVLGSIFKFYIIPGIIILYMIMLVTGSA